MDNFHQQALEYHELSNIQRDLANWTAEWLESDGTGLEGIEFGAGTGHFTKLVLQTGMTLRAVDRSSRMVTVGKASFPMAQWKEGNAWAPDSNMKADRVLSSALLQWCPDPAKTFARWRVLLREGGRVLCGLFISETLPELVEVLPNAPPFTWRSMDEWKAMFEKAGFIVERTELSKRVYSFDNAHALLRNLHRIGATRSLRFSPGVLRTAMQKYDSMFAHDQAVRSTWTFMRIECF